MIGAMLFIRSLRWVAGQPWFDLTSASGCEYLKQIKNTRRKKSPAQGGPTRGSSALGLGGNISALNQVNMASETLFRS
jgi:hypothetical protein